MSNGLNQLPTASTIGERSNTIIERIALEEFDAERVVMHCDRKLRGGFHLAAAFESDGSLILFFQRRGQ